MDEDREELDENGLSAGDYAGMALEMEQRLAFVWRAIRYRLVEAVRRGDRASALEAAAPAAQDELAALLAELPLCALEEEAPRIQLLDVSLDLGEGFLFTIREESRSGLAALLLGEGVLEADVAVAFDGLGKLLALRAADAPRERAHTLEVEAGFSSVLPEDYVPPRYRVEPAGGEGFWSGLSEASAALHLAQALSRDGVRYLVFDREGLSSRGELVASFESGQRL